MIDISRLSLYSYNYWPFNIKEPEYSQARENRIQDIDRLSLYYYNYWPLKENLDSGIHIQHEKRIRILEREEAVVITTPYIDVDTLAVGCVTRLETKVESLLTPKRKIDKYIVNCLELDIKGREIAAYEDGSVEIEISVSDTFLISRKINVEIQAVDDLGNRSMKVRQELRPVLGKVGKPEFRSPREGETIYVNDVDGVRFEVGDFRTDGFPDKADWADWKITRDRLGYDIVEADGKSGDITEHVFIKPRLSGGEIFYVWVRHHGRYLGYSDWSVRRYKAGIAVVEKPRIFTDKVKVLDLDRYSMWEYVNSPLVEDMSGVNKISIRKENLVVRSGDFEVRGGEDTHYSTEWRVSLDEWGEETIFLKTEREELYRGVIPYLPEMKDKVPFFVSCRYVGVNYGRSEWSDSVKYLPELGVILAPSIVSPEMGDVVLMNEGMEVEASEFMTQYYEDEYVGTEWKITEDMTGNSVVAWAESEDRKYKFEYEDLQGLEKNTIYYVFASHKGKVLSPSDWSLPVAIQSFFGGIVRPEITMPENGTLVLTSGDVRVKSSPYKVSYIEDKHISTDWKIAEDKAGEYVVKLDEDSLDLTEHVFEGLKLTNTKRYYLWVRYKGDLGEISDWSECVEIKAIEGRSDKCRINMPEDGKVVVLNDMNLNMEVSLYSCTGEDDGYAKTEVKICSDETGDEIAIWKVSPVNKVSVLSAELVEKLESDKTYYIFARNVGKLYEAPDWSESVKISALTAYVKTPEIVSPKSQTIFHAGFYAVSGDFGVEHADDELEGVGWLVTDKAENVLHTARTSGLVAEIPALTGDCLLSCQHKGKKFEWGEFSKTVEVIFKSAEEANERVVYRHPSLKGSVIEYNDLGIWRRVVVLDAQYRFISGWGESDYTALMPVYSMQNTGANWFIDGVSRDGENWPTISANTLTEDDLNRIWRNSMGGMTSRDCCDVWLNYADMSLIRRVREIEVDYQSCDIPNFQTMLRIYCEAERLDALDTSLDFSGNKALGLRNIYGWWRIGGCESAWTSTQYSKESMRSISVNGECSYSDKNSICAVIPVVEI